MLYLFKQKKINIKKLITILLCIIIISGCCKNKNEIKSIDELISYKVLDYFKKGGYYYLDDTNTLIEQDYYSIKDGGYFQIQIFSYKEKDIFSDEENTIDLNNYINLLNKKEELIIDNHTFYIGYTKSEEIENVNAKAYVKHDNYVLEFLMSNSDEIIKEEQYNDFKEMLKTIKFK